MDVLLKLRVLIWVLVISLWGVMVYQYLGEDEKDAAQMRAVAYRPVEPGAAAPAPDLPAPQVPAAAPPPDVAVPAAAPAAPPVATAALAAPAAPAQIVPGATADPANNVLPAHEAAGPAPSDDRERDDETPVPEAPPTQRARAAARRIAERSQPVELRREDRTQPLPDPPVPPGFRKTVTRHFNIYSEGTPASEDLVALIENIHGNLMLDLAPFSPWADDQRVSVFLFKTQDAYRLMTGRPGWSGGASSVAKRKVYLFDSEELPGILAHELTHIYFDGFFLGGTTDPLWLSEGMATLSQVERGLAAPTWLRENLAILESGGGVPFGEFTSATRTSGWSDEKVRLWYAQAYSVVRYLIRTQYRSSFYQFASYLREGRPQAEALYRAYGAPFTRLRALEIAWRHEISRPAARAK